MHVMISLVSQLTQKPRRGLVKCLCLRALYSAHQSDSSTLVTWQLKYAITPWLVQIRAIAKFWSLPYWLRCRTWQQPPVMGNCSAVATETSCYPISKSREKPNSRKTHGMRLILNNARRKHDWCITLRRGPYTQLNRPLLAFCVRGGCLAILHHDNVYGCGSEVPTSA